MLVADLRWLCQVDADACRTPAACRANKRPATFLRMLTQEGRRVDDFVCLLASRHPAMPYLGMAARAAPRPTTPSQTPSPASTGRPVQRPSSAATPYDRALAAYAAGVAQGKRRAASAGARAAAAAARWRVDVDATAREKTRAHEAVHRRCIAAGEAAERVARVVAAEEAVRAAAAASQAYEWSELLADLRACVGAAGGVHGTPSARLVKGGGGGGRYVVLADESEGRSAVAAAADKELRLLAALHVYERLLVRPVRRRAFTCPRIAPPVLTWL